MALNPTNRLSNHASAAAQSDSFQDDVLCERCVRIDFKGIFALTCPPEGRVVLHLGTLVGCSSCALCRLFYSSGRVPRLFRTDGFPPGWESWAVLRPVFADLPEPLGGTQKTAQAGLGITVLPSQPGKPILHSKELLRDNSLILPRRSATTSSLRLGMVEGAPINRWKADHSRIKGWLQQCDDKHSDTCSRLPQGRPLQLHCIDCHTQEVILMGPGDDYFALSYVWGNTNGLAKVESNKSPPLNGRAPQVVQDAMAIVQMLGGRYLWVDQYCINEADEDIRMGQILHMDQIYEGAYGTKVAGAGFDANFGLPGVSRPRFEQRVVETQGITLVAVSRSLRQELKIGGWMTRGWTYQEAVLSRRLIIFTEYQAHFVCTGMTCGEAVVTGPEDVRIGRAERPITLQTAYFESFESYPGTQRKASNKGPWLQLLDHIKNYSWRSLTFQDDALNALRGILSRSPFFSYYGIPFGLEGPSCASKDVNKELLEVGFLRSLIWTRLEGAANLRRATARFPSWSWASWQSPVPFQQPHHSQAMPLLPRAELTDEHLLLALETDPAGRGALPETSPCLQLVTTVVKLRFRSMMSPMGTTFRVLCRCYQTASHGDEGTPSTCGHARVEAACSTWETVWFDEDLPMETITHKTWDCALLFTGPSGHNEGFLQRTFLVIEWKDTIAYRAGWIQINDDRQSRFDIAMRDAPQERGG